MERKKAVVDAAIAAATDKRGVLLVNTGSSRAIQRRLRRARPALGHGLQAGVVQFVKGRSDTGEAFFRRQPGVELARDGRRLHLGHPEPRRRHRQRPRGWEQARAFCATRPSASRDPRRNQHRAQSTPTSTWPKSSPTSRPAPPTSTSSSPAGRAGCADQAADTVTDMGAQTAFKAGIAAQAGVEFWRKTPLDL